jgi:hypothetical protein
LIVYGFPSHSTDLGTTATAPTVVYTGGIGRGQPDLGASSADTYDMASVIAAAGSSVLPSRNLSYFSVARLVTTPSLDTTKLIFTVPVLQGFTTFLGPLEVATNLSALSGGVLTMEVTVKEPTGGVDATASRTAVPLGIDPADDYTNITISAATLNAMGFAAGDIMQIELEVRNSVISTTYEGRWSRIRIPFG